MVMSEAFGMIEKLANGRVKAGGNPKQSMMLHTIAHANQENAG
jgi:hypothetical protein